MLSDPVVSAPAQPAPTEAGEDQRRASTEFDTVLQEGFRRLTFPAAMEARYLRDREPERLSALRWALLFYALLNAGILSADWLMVPDQFTLALRLRLLVLAPLALIAFAFFSRVKVIHREWIGFVCSTAMAIVGVALSLTSHDSLAPAYLVALELILLFNSGITGMRFWMAMRANTLVLLLFAAALPALHNPPWVIMFAMALVLVSTVLFTLVGAYRLEREDRTNWLMLQNEHLLIVALESGIKRLNHMARFDPLTGLANRRHFDEFLARVWARARHDGDEVAVLLMDVDHFKGYNDHYGHIEGDACLQVVAKALRDHVRQPEDLLARYGGEEFVVVLPKADLATARAAAERVRAGIAGLDWPNQASPVHKRVTVSIGVASVHADAPGASPAALIAAADAALYQAKSQGRNKAVPYEASALPALGHGASPPMPARPTPLPVDAERDEVAAASMLFERSGWRLRFTPALELAFLNRVALRLQYFSVSGLLSLIVFNGFLLVDYLMVRDVFMQAVITRVVLFTPFALCIQIALRHAREWVLRHFSASMVESVILFRSVMTAACLLYLLAISHDPLSQYYHVGLVVIVVYVNTIQRLRFGYAVAFSLIVLAMHLASALALPAFNPRLTMPIALLLTASVVFTLLPVYGLERDERRRYLLTRRRAHLHQDLADVQQRVRALAHTDALTGLFNRRHFQACLDGTWQRAQHDGGHVAIIMLDVDHFKKYNDHYGHPAGDLCLIQVGQALTSSVRGPLDIVARFGGEEFIVLLPQTNADEARHVAERIREAVQAAGIAHQASDTADVVTVSVGVASGQAGLSPSTSSLISAADAALYNAKQAGRNRVM